MKTKDLEVLNEMPFLFWAKDEQGRHLWGNRAINQLAKENVVGKTDHELIWAGNAEALRAVDKKVFETGQPSCLYEHVDNSGQGKATLSVCKFVGELEGKKCVFGVSFVME